MTLTIGICRISPDCCIRAIVTFYFGAASVSYHDNPCKQTINEKDRACEFTRFTRLFAFSGILKKGLKAGCSLTSGQRIAILSISAIPVFRVNSQALRERKI